MSEKRGTAAGLPHESTAGFERSLGNRTAPITPPTPDGLASAPWAAPRLMAGDVLASRYTVVRFVARGGMGEVYEVRDETLQTRVALKTVLPEFSSDREAVERFRREVLLARRITHPNVCRIHDLSSGEVRGEPLHFLTMEFLDGETLSRRLRTRGRMATEEVLPLLRQIAAGLDAAHAEGVVHRDFKTSNVILVTRETSTEVRPVITDFGIARAQSADLGDAVTGSKPVGTPEYMAPEQVTGGTIGPASDLYALGIVLYEMLTGHTPFGGGTPFQVALRRVHERPRPPREAVTDLEPRWNEAVLRCLERNPASRFGRAQDLVHFLETGIRPPRRGFRRRLLGGVLLAVLLLMVVLGLVVRHRADRPEKVSIRPRPVTAIATLAAAEDLGEYRWVPAALGQLLEFELGAKPSSLRVIPGKSVGWARKSLLDADSTVEGTGRERLGTLLGTHSLLVGKVRRGVSPGQLAVHIDPVGGMPAVSESFASDDVLGAASRLGVRLRQVFGLSLNGEERAWLDARRPRSVQAARLFAEGVSRRVADDIPGAQRLFAAASAADGSFHAAVLAEAESWLAIGNLRQARLAAQRAKDLARTLSLREQRESEVVLARASEDEGTARLLEKALFADWPDEPRLAEALVDAASTVEEGRAVLGRWRNASPSGTFDFVLEGEEAALLARAEGAPAADTAFERLEERARALGATQELGTILDLRATAFARSDYSRSLAYERQAQEAFQRGGFLARLAQAKGDEALYLREKGDPQQDVPLRESLAIYRRLGLRRAASNSLVLMGWSAFYQGDVVQARARLQEMEDESRAIEASPTSWALGLRAWVEWTEGNLAESRRSLQEMRKRAEVDGSWNAHAGMPNLEGMILTEEDRIQEAIAVLEQGREQFASLGAADYEWKCALMACRASCRGGRPAEGLACLSRVDADRVKNSPWLLPQFEAECLIEAGESSKAKRALARASSLGESYGANHLGFEVLRGRVETLEGRARQAATRLRSVAGEARRRHWNGVALEGELALGRAELASGVPDARKRLLAVEEEASRRGFILIGRRAAAAMAAD